jgi:transcriptional regulator with XRE-family HTH domain
MRTLLHTEFDALLALAGVSQARFARLTGVTARQVNNWARGRALVPQWAALLAAALRDFSPEALTIALEEAEFNWREILGVPPNADTAVARRAMTRLALRYHPSGQGRPARAHDPHQCRLRRRAARRVSEKVADPLNSKGTN